MTKKTTIFLLDNFDSFTYNLVDELATLGYELVVYRNNICADALFSKMQACENNVVLLLSPGPGNPTEAGCMIELIGKVKGTFPILGICLGHQAIVEQSGGTIGTAGDIVHGKTSKVQHNEHRVFDGLDNPLYVARYHSLMATSVPNNLDVIASLTTDEQVIPMAVIDETDKMLGFQFHPESILTTYGSKLLQQSLDYLTFNQ